MPSDIDNKPDASEFAAHLQAQSIRAALQVHARGRLWERSGQAPALAFSAGQVSLGDSSRGAQLINLWL